MQKIKTAATTVVLLLLLALVPQPRPVRAIAPALIFFAGLVIGVTITGAAWYFTRGEDLTYVLLKYNQLNMAGMGASGVLQEYVNDVGSLLREVGVVEDDATDAFNKAYGEFKSAARSIGAGVPSGSKDVFYSLVVVAVQNRRGASVNELAGDSNLAYCIGPCVNELPPGFKSRDALSVMEDLVNSASEFDRGYSQVVSWLIVASTVLDGLQRIIEMTGVDNAQLSSALKKIGSRVLFIDCLRKAEEVVPGNISSLISQMEDFRKDVLNAVLMDREDTSEVKKLIYVPVAFGLANLYSRESKLYVENFLQGRKTAPPQGARTFVGAIWLRAYAVENAAKTVMLFVEWNGELLGNLSGYLNRLRARGYADIGRHDITRLGMLVSSGLVGVQDVFVGAVERMAQNAPPANAISNIESFVRDDNRRILEQKKALENYTDYRNVIKMAKDLAGRVLPVTQQDIPKIGDIYSSAVDIGGRCATGLSAASEMEKEYRSLVENCLLPLAKSMVKEHEGKRAEMERNMQTAGEGTKKLYNLLIGYYDSAKNSIYGPIENNLRENRIGSAFLGLLEAIEKLTYVAAADDPNALLRAVAMGLDCLQAGVENAERYMDAYRAAGIIHENEVDVAFIRSSYENMSKVFGQISPPLDDRECELLSNIIENINSLNGLLSNIFARLAVPEGDYRTAVIEEYENTKKVMERARILYENIEGKRYTSPLWGSLVRRLEALLENWNNVSGVFETKWLPVLRNVTYNLTSENINEISGVVSAFRNMRREFNSILSAGRGVLTGEYVTVVALPACRVQITLGVPENIGYRIVAVDRSGIFEGTRISGTITLPGRPSTVRLYENGRFYDLGADYWTYRSGVLTITENIIPVYRFEGTPAYIDPSVPHIFVACRVDFTSIVDTQVSQEKQSDAAVPFSGQIFFILRAPLSGDFCDNILVPVPSRTVYRFDNFSIQGMENATGSILKHFTVENTTHAVVRLLETIGAGTYAGIIRWYEPPLAVLLDNATENVRTIVENGMVLVEHTVPVVAFNISSLRYKDALAFYQLVGTGTDDFVDNSARVLAGGRWVDANVSTGDGWILVSWKTGEIGPLGGSARFVIRYCVKNDETAARTLLSLCENMLENINAAIGGLENIDTSQLAAMVENISQSVEEGRALVNIGNYPGAVVVLRRCYDSLSVVQMIISGIRSILYGEEGTSFAAIERNIAEINEICDAIDNLYTMKPLRYGHLLGLRNEGRAVAGALGAVRQSVIDSIVKFKSDDAIAILRNYNENINRVLGLIDNAVRDADQIKNTLLQHANWLKQRLDRIRYTDTSEEKLAHSTILNTINETLSTSILLRKRAQTFSTLLLVENRLTLFETQVVRKEMVEVGRRIEPGLAAIDNISSLITLLDARKENVLRTLSVSNYVRSMYAPTIVNEIQSKMQNRYTANNYNSIVDIIEAARTRLTTLNSIRDSIMAYRARGEYHLAIELYDNSSQLIVGTLDNLVSGNTLASRILEHGRGILASEVSAMRAAKDDAKAKMDAVGKVDSFLAEKYRRACDLAQYVEEQLERDNCYYLDLAVMARHAAGEFSSISAQIGTPPEERPEDRGLALKLLIIAIIAVALVILLIRWKFKKFFGKKKSRIEDLFAET